MAWKFTHDGNTYREGDVTVDQWVDICDLSGTSGSSPIPFASPKDAKAIFSVVVGDRTGDRDAAGKVIGGMSTDEFLELFEDVVDDDLPSEFEDGIPQ